MMLDDRTMTAEAPVFNNVAPLRTVQALATLIEKLQHRQDGLAGIGVLSGWSGFGKTSAAIWAANIYSCIHIEVESTWSKKFLCEAILSELGERRPRGTVAHMVQRIKEGLATRDVPLIIDEADHLMRNATIEVLRAIYEGSQVPLILIGEEEMPVKMKAWDRVHNRVAGWAQAQPANLEELYLLAKIYAPGIEIDEELGAFILEGSAFNMRRISTNLADARELALTLGVIRLGKADWGERSLFTGEAPKPRPVPGTKVNLGRGASK